MKKFMKKAIVIAIRARMALANNKAEGFLDTALQILISIIIGSLLLAGLYLLFGDTILPTLSAKIQELFNYAG